jgi:hypothetical protein
LPSALVIVVSVGTVVGRPWVLTGDFSFTEFLVRAIPTHPPLIGVTGRIVDAGSHPGPSMAYLLWPGYRLFGSNAFALAVSAAVLHIAAIVGVVVLARRLGGPNVAAAIGGSLSVLVVSLAPRFFLEPWNVWIPVFAFALFLVLVWGLVLERLELLPWAVAIGSHCMQSHVSYAVMVGGLLGLVTVWLGWCWWRTDRLDGRRPLRWLTVSVVTLVVVWLPPVIDQLRPGEGNLRKLYREFSNPAEPFIGVRAALKAMVGRFNLLGPWLHAPATDPRSSPNLLGFLLFVALIVVGVWCAWRRRGRVELALFLVLGTVTLLGAVSTMRIYGPFFEYVIRFMLPLVALWVGAALWSVIVTLQARVPSVRGRSTWIVAPLALVVTSVGVVKAAGAEVPYARDVAITAALSRSTRATLDSSRRYQINEMDPVSIGSVGFGLALDLEHHDWHSGVGPWGAAGAMPYRVVADEHADAALWYVASKRLIDRFAAMPDAKVIARYDVRTPTEAIHSDDLERQIIAGLCAAGGEKAAEAMYLRWGETRVLLDPSTPPLVHSLLYEFTALRQPAAVIQLPPGAPAIDIQAPVTGLCS